MNRITQNLNIIAVPLFFILLALVGLVIYQDYGYSWDEGIQRAIGLHTYNYVLHDSQELFSHPGQYYGSFFEFGLIGAERILNLTSTQDIYFMRHLVNFSFFFAAIFVFYRIAKKRFDNHWISLLGVSFLVLSPRIFADGFYNSKDIILLSLFIFAFYFIIKFFEQPSWLNIILLSFFSALVIDLRLIGLLVPVIVVLMASMFIILVDSWSINWKQILFYIFVYGVLTIVFVYILWPYLWPDPIGNFLESLRITGNYSPQANMKIFYLGSYTTADSLPAHYIFLWLLITTPVSYTALFMFGLNAYRTRVVDLMNLQKSKTDLIFLLWFFLPLLALIILKPIIYDGWRHFYFIYPAFILIALVGLHTLSQYINNKIHSPNFQRIVLSLVSVLLLVNTFSVGLFMYKNHPYQNMYFNLLSGGIDTAQNNFELDYWGLSFREGLEYIAKNDSDQLIPISILYGSPLELEILQNDVKHRFEIVMINNLEQSATPPKYLLTNFRWGQGPDYSLENLEDKEFYSVRVEGTKIMSIYKL